MEISLNKNGHVPLYFQIQEFFRDKIENNDIKPGSQLPTERELSDELNISRVTIRKAMRGLIAEGLCEKKVGKGIFVSDGKIPLNVHKLEGTTELLKNTADAMETIVNEKKLILAGKKLADLLDLKTDDKILYLKRIRYINETPVIIEKTNLPLKLFPDLDKHDFSHSLYKILKDEYDTFPNKSRGSFNILMAKEEEARLLNLQLNTPLLVKKATIYSRQGIPIEYTDSVYRSDQFNFLVDSTIIE